MIPQCPDASTTINLVQDKISMISALKEPRNEFIRLHLELTKRINFSLLGIM